MWTHGRRTAGQFVEKSSSYGEGLHRPRVLSQNNLPLQSYHSDPFLAKDTSWPPQVPPMYMKRQYNSGIIAPYSGEEVPGTYGVGVSQLTRARGRLNHPPTMERRGTLPARFFPHSDRWGAEPLWKTEAKKGGNFWNFPECRAGMRTAPAIPRVKPEPK